MENDIKANSTMITLPYQKSMSMILINSFCNLSSTNLAGLDTLFNLWSPSEIKESKHKFRSPNLNQEKTLTAYFNIFPQIQ